MLPATLVARPHLLDRLTAGASKRLTAVVGVAGTGKSVLLSSWAATRSPDLTSWLACDGADADPVRFWTGFIQAVQIVSPEFGVEAAQLLATDQTLPADIVASIANDARALPSGFAIIVDDFHFVTAVATRYMTNLLELWPAETAQLVVASRFDPSLRLHRLRMGADLCEFRARDLCLSFAESRDLMINFGVEVADTYLRRLHQRSEGWPAALQMMALSLRSTTDPERAARALDVRMDEMSDYFISEVIDQQPPEIARFMLDTCILGELTPDSCEAVTGVRDAAALLRRIDSAHLFLVAVDDERSSYRHHPLIRQILQAELRLNDRAREQKLQLRAAEWFESTGNARRAAHHLFAARQADQALTLLKDRVVTDFLRDPTPSAPPDLGVIDPTQLALEPQRLLTLAFDLLLSGDAIRGGEYLALFVSSQAPLAPDSTSFAELETARALHYLLVGQPDEALAAALSARAVRAWTQLSNPWNVVVSLILLRIYACLSDFGASEREALAVLAAPGLTESVRQVLVAGPRAMGWLEAGRLAEAAGTAITAEKAASGLGLAQHVLTLDCTRALAGLAFERRDFDTAEQLTEQVLSHAGGQAPLFQFLALLDRAAILSGRGQFRDALGTVEAARRALPATKSSLLVRADELEALVRLSLGDLRRPAELAVGLPAVARGLLLTRLALAAGDDGSARQHLEAIPSGGLTPRRSLVRQLLSAGVAIERGDPRAASLLGDALATARRAGFYNTIVTTAPQVTSYLVEHSAPLQQDLFTRRVIGAAVEERAIRANSTKLDGMVAKQLTPAEHRILKLLPTSTYQQMAATLYVSRDTVKTHLRSIYHKLGAASRADAIERAIDLSLL